MAAMSPELVKLKDVEQKLWEAQHQLQLIKHWEYECSLLDSIRDTIQERIDELEYGD